MFSSGVRDLDILLGGGYPDKSTALIMGRSGTGKELLAYRFILSGVLEKDVCVYVTRLSVSDVVRDMEARGIKVGGKDLLWIAGEDTDRKFTPNDLAALSYGLKEVLGTNRTRRIRIVVDSLSSLLMMNSSDSVYRFLVQLLADAKRYDACMLAAMEEDMHEPSVVAAMEQIFDGVLEIGYREGAEDSPPLIRVKKMTGVVIPPKAQVVLSERRGRGKEEKGTTGRRRIAVLPLVSLSADPNDEYFADGTTEEMISTLSNINDLTVISRTSVMQYKGTKKNLADIGKELGADTMLEGSVRKAGNRVRITVQLLDALEDKHLWAQSYDRELKDVFAVQSDIAKRVGQALKVKLLANEVSQIQKKPTDSTDAYLLYLKGRQHWNKRSEDSIRKAVEYFHLALDSDPDFALAHVGLADSYSVLGDHGYITPAESSAKSRPAVLKALELDESLAEAHTAYAWGLTTYDWNWDSAEEEYRKAIELNSNYASAHQWYSLLLKQEGRLEEALVEIRKALELDPLAPMMSNNMGSLLYCLERYEDAIMYYNRSLAIEQDFVPSFWGIGLTYAMKGEFDQATFWQEKLARLSSQKADALVGVAAIQARAGKTDQALRTLDSATALQTSGRIPATSFAYFFAAMHDEDKAFEWMKKSVEEHEIGIPYTKTDPWFKELRDRPRFLEILKKLGLDKY